MEQWATQGKWKTSDLLDASGDAQSMELAVTDRLEDEEVRSRTKFAQTRVSHGLLGNK